MKPFLIAISLLLSACAQLPRPPSENERLFPHGKYEHRVTVTANTPSMEFRGAVRSTPEDLWIVGLSPVGTTVFRVHEKFKTGRVTKEIYLPSLAKYQDHFMDLYRLVRAALLAKKEQMSFRRYGAEFQFFEPTADGWPKRMRIQHPKLSIEIEVLNYEP